MGWAGLLFAAVAVWLFIDLAETGHTVANWRASAALVCVVVSLALLLGWAVEAGAS